MAKRVLRRQVRDDLGHQPEPEKRIVVAGGEPAPGGMSRATENNLTETTERPDEVRDCGVCGVSATIEVRVTDDGYYVPRCDAHYDMPAYQAESRLAIALSAEQPDDRLTLTPEEAREVLSWATAGEAEFTVSTDPPRPVLEAAYVKLRRLAASGEGGENG